MSAAKRARNSPVMDAPTPTGCCAAIVVEESTGLRQVQIADRFTHGFTAICNQRQSTSHRQYTCAAPPPFIPPPARRLLLVLVLVAAVRGAWWLGRRIATKDRGDGARRLTRVGIGVPPGRAHQRGRRVSEGVLLGRPRHILDLQRRAGDALHVREGGRPRPRRCSCCCFF